MEELVQTRAYGIALATDGSGDVFVVGNTTSSNFPTLGPLQSYLAGSASSGFVTKLNSTGTALVYSTYIGGSSTSGTFDGVNAVAVDSSNQAYVTGQTFNSAFVTSSTAYQKTCGSCSGGNSNAFVAAINASGNALVYSTFLGGNATDQGDGIAVDSSGNAYVTGAATSSNFPHTTGSLAGSTDAFVTKLNSAGSALTYSIFLGARHWTREQASPSTPLAMLMSPVRPVRLRSPWSMPPSHPLEAALAMLSYRRLARRARSSFPLILEGRGRTTAATWEQSLLIALEPTSMSPATRLQLRGHQTTFQLSITSTGTWWRG